MWERCEIIEVWHPRIEESKDQLCLLLGQDESLKRTEFQREICLENPDEISWWIPDW